MAPWQRRLWERNGYRVKRFWNNDILMNPEGIFINLLEMLK